MRRRRAGLQVNTFPFLAVLLCAMGSLILLLLVIDRRAKVVARNKALESQELARLLDDAAMKKRREEWQRQRRALHALLAAQHDELKTQLKNLHSQSKVAVENLRLEKARQQTAEQALARGKDDLARLRASMAQWRNAIAQNKRDDEKAQALQQQAIQQLARDLIELEQTLEALRLARRRQERAFSLVPYGGKRGDTRKPVYVECNRSGLTFYPQPRTIPEQAIGLASIRAEVDKRADAQGRAYLLFLVRPDGITAYTIAQGALRNGNMDYGYELVEADWEFDFACEERLAAQWQTPAAGVASPSIASILGPPRSVPPPLMSQRGGDGNGYRPGVGAIIGSNGRPSGPGLGFIGADVVGGTQPDRHIGFGNGARPGVGARAGSNGARSGPELGFTGDEAPGGTQPDRHIGFGNGASARPNAGTVTGSNRASAGAGPGSDDDSSGVLGGPGIGSGLGNVSRPGAEPAARFPGTTTSSGQGNEPGPWRSAPRGWPGGSLSASSIGQGGLGQGGIGQGGIGHRGNGQGGQGGIGQGGGKADGQLGAASNGFSGAPVQGEPHIGGTEISEPGAAATRSPSAGSAIPWKGRPAVIEPPDSPRAGAAGAEVSSPDQDGSPSDQARPLVGLPPPDAEPGNGPGLPYPGGPRFGSPKPRARPLVPLSRMLGNRDFPLVLECTEDAIVIQPWGIRFENVDLPKRPDPNHKLVQTINKLIARRQATVRESEPPYRPVLHFQIQPGGLRSYYLAYPMLEALHLPMVRENAQEEAEIRR